MGVCIDVWDRRQDGRFAGLHGETVALGLTVSAEFPAKLPYPSRSPGCLDRQGRRTSRGSHDVIPSSENATRLEHRNRDCGIRGLRASARPNLSIPHRRNGPAVEHSRLADAHCHHPRHGAGGHGDGKSNFVGLVYRGNIGNCYRLRRSTDCDLGARDVRRVGAS